jgi:hypothetical protein
MDEVSGVRDGRVVASDYMHFAKLRAAAKFNLASSGVADCALADIAPEAADLVLHDSAGYGWPPLVETIAERFAVDPACVVVPGGGCSFANHLAMAAIVNPGDEALVESPGYELLASTLSYLGARVRAFERDPATGWWLDAAATAQRIGPATRLVVATNLHNPTGARAEASEISALAQAAPHFVIDEAYLELTFEGGRPHTAFTEEGDIVVTSSLTKAYGLSGLRCGWILAPRPLAERMRRLNDLFGVKAPHIAERLAVVAFGRLPALRARASALIEPNRAAYREILGGHPALDQQVFDDGTTVFPRLRRGDGDGFFRLLTETFETSVGPGRYFGRPDHIRIGLGGDPLATREGLTRIAEALQAWEIGG